MHSHYSLPPLNYFHTEEPINTHSQVPTAEQRRLCAYYSSADKELPDCNSRPRRHWSPRACSAQDKVAQKDIPVAQPFVMRVQVTLTSSKPGSPPLLFWACLTLIAFCAQGGCLEDRCRSNIVESPRLYPCAFFFSKSCLQQKGIMMSATENYWQ